MTTVKRPLRGLALILGGNSEAHGKCAVCHRRFKNGETCHILTETETLPAERHHGGTCHRVSRQRDECPWESWE